MNDLVVSQPAFIPTAFRELVDLKIIRAIFPTHPEFDPPILIHHVS